MSTLTASAQLPGSSLWLTALEHAFNAIVQTDAAGNIVEWNPQAERCFGWFRHEALGTPLHQLVLPPDRHQAHLQWLGLLTDTTPDQRFHTRMEAAGMHRTGHLFPIEMTVSLVRTPQGVAFIAIFCDLTERRSTDQTMRSVRRPY